jgi:hypothetical protein
MAAGRDGERPLPGRHGVDRRGRTNCRAAQASGVSCAARGRIRRMGDKNQVGRFFQPAVFDGAGRPSSQSGRIFTSCEVARGWVQTCGRKSRICSTLDIDSCPWNNLAEIIASETNNAAY